MSPFPPEMLLRAAALVAKCRSAKLKIATAESCTGGLIAGLLTEVPGSSDVLDRGFVTYSNEAKQEMLGAPVALLAEHGAVSEEIAQAMAWGAIQHSRANLAVSVTGVAGPGGGSAGKPVGLVHFACAGPGDKLQLVEKRFGDLGRSTVRMASVEQALSMLEKAAAGQ